MLRTNAAALSVAAAVLTATAALLLAPAADGATPQPAGTPAPPAPAPESRLAGEPRTAPRTSPAAATPAAQPRHCSDPLIAVLKAAGFRGQDLREAWAIVMRESRGRAEAISATGDYGLFQFNRAAWRSAPWWNEAAMLDPAHNATIAHQVSRGGKDWRPWGLTGDGRIDASAYPTWTAAQVRDRIAVPYQRWLAAYPC